MREWNFLENGSGGLCDVRARCAADGVSSGDAFSWEDWIDGWGMWVLCGVFILKISRSGRYGEELE